MNLQHLCCHTDRGLACNEPGSLTTSTHGTEHWFCHTHFPPFVTWNLTGRTRPPQGFAALKALVTKAKPGPVDFEAIAERMALQEREP